MKHQQIQLASKRNFIRIMALMAMLAVMVCGMILAVNAADATVEPKQLTWASDASASATYNPNSNDYLDVAVSIPALNGIEDGDDVSVDMTKTYTVSFSASTAGQNIMVTYINVVLTGADKDNYTVDPLMVNISVNPIEITSITWEGGNSFTYGADLSGIKAIGHYGDNKTVEMAVSNLVNVGDAGSYTLKANVPNEKLYEVVGDAIGDATKEITIEPKLYNVVLNGREFLDNGDIITPNASNKYQLVVEEANGEKLPAEILKGITYKYNGTDVVPTTFGTYAVEATMPTLNNYKFNVTTLAATMEVVRNYKVVSTSNGSAIVILGENGISNSISVTFNDSIEFARKAIRGLKAYQGYALNITGAEAGDKFSIYIPVATDLIAKKNCLPMSVDNLYIYNGSTKALAKDTYTVSISEDGSYYIIEGYVPQGEITFMLAPDFNTPFWSSAIGIALIILIALVLLVVIPIFVGMKLLQIENSSRNPVISVETDGNVPEVEPVIIPDLIEDPDAILEESVDALADSLMAEIAPEEEEVDADASEVVADAMAELNAEIAEIDLGNADGALDDMADQMALDLAEQIDAEGDAADLSDEVKKAVAEAMAENFNESADATDAIALVEDEEIVEEPIVEEVIEEEPVIEEVVEEEPVIEEFIEEPIIEEVVEEEPVVVPAVLETEEAEDEEESFGGFGSMPLDYIDAIVEAERYAEMLEQESRGEVQLVTRYRRSYLSRLVQSQGSIQDYYNVIKNLLLSYKGVKSRTSWNFESFNVGRTPLVKFNAKTRTLYVYIAFSPEELVDTKYNFTDMSEKKKYAAVPVLLKVKGERKFKHAVELITKLCEEKLQLPKKKNFQEIDYRTPFKTTEELVNEGIIKMMVAAIPVAAPVAEEAIVEEAPVAEEAIEEAVVEEIPAEEAPVQEEIIEEAVAEEVPAEEAIVEEVVAEEAVKDNDQNA